MTALDQHRARLEWLLAGFLILLIAAISYLVLARQFGFYNDDWYLAYAGKAAGPDFYQQVFAIDRPFRAYFVGLLYHWFGLNAPLYAYLAYALRAAGGFAMFWLLRLLWPRLGRLNIALAVLFTIYPGWTDQPGAFDFMTHLLSFALMVFSIALTVRAVSVQRLAVRAGLAAVAVLAQVVALLLMEYYIGMEGLRFLLVLYLVWLGRDVRTAFHAGWPRRLAAALGVAAPYLAGAFGFMVWRTFIFDNQRAVTDIGGMVSSLAGSPLLRGLNLLMTLFKDFINTSFSAWFVPLYLTTSNLRLRDSLMAAGLGLLAAGLLWAALAWLNRKPLARTDDTDCPWEDAHMAGLGALGVLLALVPVALGDRHVVFPDFARFTLPASVGVIFLLGGLLRGFTRPPLRLAVPLVLVVLSVMLHYGNSAIYAGRWQVMRNFWWQVYWRAPQIHPETVLAVQYADVGIPEDYFVWGPANLIYNPGPVPAGQQLITPINAVVLSNETMLDIELRRGHAPRERRGIVSGQDLERVLLWSMPTRGACARAIDGRSVELSENERSNLVRIAPFSHLDLIDTSGQAPLPPQELFGPEPEHTWCYYYEKAELARQRGDWQEVARLGDEAQARKLTPTEWVEWMPFAQGYAYTGNQAQVERIANLYWGVFHLRVQACNRFTKDAAGYGAQNPGGHAFLIETFCR